jgi:hypothetical protein
MLKQYMTSRFAQIVTMALIVSTASGCATVSKATDWLTGKSPPENEDYVVLGAPSADEYLRELNDLVAGDPDKQADILADASSAAKLTPGPSTKLRLGLVLATPGHAGSDPARAQSALREVLAQTELMTTAEIAFATIALNNVESQIGVSSSAASAARLQESTSQAARNEEQAISQRLATSEAENRRLRADLAEAEQKLDAITSIERSIRDQE